MNRTKLLWRSGLWTVMAVGALLGAASAADGIPRDQFGAATVEHQLQALAKLKIDWDFRLPPPSVDAAVWAAFVPADNTLTAERVALGKKLYFDVRLSADGTVSCATCHDVTRGFTDQRTTSVGIKKQLGKRNAPTSMNVALLQTMFLEGRSPSVEHQARMPILNPIEMGMPNDAAAVKAIAADAEYQAAFRKAYNRDVNYEDVGRAIAAFERTLMFLDSPFRRFAAGDKRALSPEAQAGWDLFNGKARCAACHPLSPANPLGADNRFHNVGVSVRHHDFDALARKALKLMEEDGSEQKLDELAVGTDLGELGRFMVTHNPADIGAFRTPQITNVGVTGPYMHDGSLATLWDVIDHYNKGGEAHAFLDGGIEPLALEEAEVDQLVAFLFALTDVRLADQNQQQMEQQKAAAAQKRPIRDNDLAHRRKLGFSR